VVAGLERELPPHHISKSVEHPSPEKILATLLSAPLACGRGELEQRRMTPPSNFILRIIVEEDAKLVRNLNAHYADAAADGGLEPDERDAAVRCHR
jgi:hypothetical protein